MLKNMSVTSILW